MQIADLEAISSIERLAYEFPWKQKIFNDCLIAGHYCIVIESQHLIVGYAVVSIAAGEAHILNLCIDISYQNQGFGGQLLKEILGYSRIHKVQRMFLEVRPSNQFAIQLYERAGFNQLGIRPDYYRKRVGREDALVLAIQLGDQV